VADLLADPAQRLVAKIQGGGRKSKRETSTPPLKYKKKKAGKNMYPSHKRRRFRINRDIFS
jgi:hypothetical protein